MVRLSNINVKIIGVGSYVPKRKVSNAEVIRRGKLDTTDEWTKEHAGIAERRALGKGESYFTMAMKAAKRAIKNANISAKEIALVVVGSETAEQYLPATASLVRDELGLKSIPAWDVNTACASFMTGFVQAAIFLEHSDIVIARKPLTKQSPYLSRNNEIARLDSRKARQATLLKIARNDRCALVIGVDSLFEHQDPCDRDGAVIFGDGAGAVVIKKTKNQKSKKSSNGIKETVLSSVPGRNAIVNPHGGYFKMERNSVKENISELILSSLSKKACKNIDHFFFHQASKRVLDDIAERLQIPREKIYTTLWNYGNTGAASIPITLDRAVRLNKIRRGDRILLCGFGAGYEYVHAMLEW